MSDSWMYVVGIMFFMFFLVYAYFVGRAEKKREIERQKKFRETMEESREGSRNDE